MDIEKCKETYEMLKKHKQLVANIDKDFFLNFAELLFNELETSKKETQEVLNDYQDLGQEMHKLESELEKKDKVINEMAKYIGEEDTTETFCDGKTMCDEDCEKCVKEYFTKKVEGK